MQLIMEPENIVGVHKITTMDTEALIQEKLTNGITEERKKVAIPEENVVPSETNILNDTNKEAPKPCQNGFSNGDCASDGIDVEDPSNGSEDTTLKTQEKDVTENDINKNTNNVDLDKDVSVNNSVEVSNAGKTEKEPENLVPVIQIVDAEQNNVGETKNELEIDVAEFNNKDLSQNNEVNTGVNVSSKAILDSAENIKDTPEEKLNKLHSVNETEIEDVEQNNKRISAEKLKNTDSVTTFIDSEKSESILVLTNETETALNTNVDTDNFKDSSKVNLELDTKQKSNDKPAEDVVQEAELLEVKAKEDTKVIETGNKNNIIPELSEKNESTTMKETNIVEKVIENAESTETMDVMDVDDTKDVQTAYDGVKIIKETPEQTKLKNDSMDVEIEQKQEAVDVKATEKMDVDEDSSNSKAENKIPINDIPTNGLENVAESEKTNGAVPTAGLSEVIKESNDKDVQKIEQATPKTNSDEVDEKEVKAITPDITDNSEEQMDVSKLDANTNSKDEQIQSESLTEPITVEEEKSAIETKISQTEKLAETDEKEVKDASERPITVEVVGEIIDCDAEKETTEESKKSTNDNVLEIKKKSEEAKPTIRKSSFCLANTLDILSDDDEDVKKDEVPKQTNDDGKCINLDDEKDSEFTNDCDIKKKSEENNKCINIEDDDDVMLIDEDSPKESDEKAKSASDAKSESDNANKLATTADKKEDDCSKPVEVFSDSDKEVPSPMVMINEKPATDEKPATPKPVKKPAKPLVPENFLKKFKINVADMTRDELEEFCLTKIVEGVLDRTNLSEIATKLKTMTQTVEEWKKKALMLTKQNRDLQIVVKTVQDEQKKRSEGIITPLKITRSVGMQVVMTDTSNDKAANRRKSAQLLTPPTARIGRSYNQRAAKQPNPPPIPVPRLVPATTNSPLKVTRQTHSVKAPVANVAKNSPPVQKVEKRPYSSIQNVTVDLTDDEPAPKQQATPRNVQQNLRLVSPQQLLTPRAQMNQNMNSPRKVFIPINSSNNIRGCQTIMIKSNTPGLRGPRGSLVRMSQAPLRLGRAPGQRHPAPLPEAPKQPQPTNWKTLPPEPDLKISKVENGIVISWKIEGYQEDSYEEIASYQLYAYQETSTPPNTLLWKKIGDVKALPLPMACTLTQFMAGFKYYFAVRAVDIKSRIGPFSLPGSILLLNK